jgi:hypothetical protein
MDLVLVKYELLNLHGLVNIQRKLMHLQTNKNIDIVQQKESANEIEIVNLKKHQTSKYSNSKCF